LSDKKDLKQKKWRKRDENNGQRRKKTLQEDGILEEVGLEEGEQ
jgi:coproporphyrinogen III oxidase